MASLEQRLVTLLGRGCVSTASDVLAEHSIDKWFASAVPDVVVFAESTAQVSKLMKFANRNRVPVTCRGAGVGYVGGCVPSRAGIVLSLARMAGILELNTKDGVAVVQPGVITGDLQQAARRKGWFYPPDPASLNECSLGGNIATNAGGPRCLKYGVTKNYVLGLTVVLANGDIIETGGRTHKNKTGFDLSALMVGSEGLLGIVTQANLRLIPHPPLRASISTGFATMRQAAAAVQKVFAAGFLPAALEIADTFTLQSAREYLGEGFVPVGKAHLLIEIDGQTASVRSEIKLLKKLLEEAKAIDPEVAIGDEACEKFWKLRREFSYSLRATGLIKLNEDIVVPRGRLVELVTFAARLQKKYGYPVACFGHAGDGNIHTNIMAADYHDDPKVRREVGKALDELFDQVIAWGGEITGEHGIGLAKKRWWKKATSKPLRDAHTAIKSALDPNGILNPGKFVESRRLK